jgi:hypothetical protein
MAGRGSTTFQKRQKEMQRKEKQQEKFAKRMQKKQDKLNGVVTADDDSDSLDNDLEIGLDEDGDPRETPE